MNSLTRSILLAAATVCGLILIIGATINLPVSARGLVTAENDILVDRLTEHVGEEDLTQAVLASDLADENPRLRAVSSRIERRAERRDGRRGERRHERRGNNEATRFLNEELAEQLDDELERIGPDAVYQIAVDAGLLSQTEADSLLVE